MNVLDDICLIKNMYPKFIEVLTNQPYDFDLKLEKIILNNGDCYGLIYKSLTILEIFCNANISRISLSTITSQIKIYSNRFSLKEAEAICISCKILKYYIIHLKKYEAEIKNIIQYLLYIFGVGNYFIKNSVIKVFQLLIQKGSSEILDKLLTDEFYEHLFLFFDSDEKQIIIALIILSEINNRKALFNDKHYLFSILKRLNYIEDISYLSSNENEEISELSSKLLKEIVYI